MLFVDRRTGSNDLLKPLRARGLPVSLTELAFGDVAFEGRGERGKPVDVGIELKELSDMVTSLRTGRLVGHQLDGLLKGYDYRWVVVEGRWRPNRYGQIVVPGKRFSRSWRPLRGQMTAGELQKKMLTLLLRGGVYIQPTNERTDTLHFIETLYRWFTDKDIDEHRSHVGVHNPHGFLSISPFRDAVMKWPGVGLRLSKAVEVRFQGSLRRAANAGVKEWAEIVTEDKHGKVRRFGTRSAEKIVAFCRGGQS